MAVSYTNEHTRKDHGDRFVCVLFYLARGIRDKGFDSDKIFSKLPTGAFNDKEQARMELVQYLQDQRPLRIEYDRNNNIVRLTDEGLRWANQVRDSPPCLEYRHL
jgi:hypothetical protein